MNSVFSRPRADGKEKIVPRILFNNSVRELMFVLSKRIHIVILKRHFE